MSIWQDIDAIEKRLELLAGCKRVGTKCRVFTAALYDGQDRNGIPVLKHHVFIHAPRTKDGLWRGTQWMLTDADVTPLIDQSNELSDMVAILSSDHDALATGWLQFDHQCACRNCQPEIDPVTMFGTIARTSAAHFGVRFFDAENVNVRDRYASPTLDGQIIPGAFECVVSQPDAPIGKIWRYRGIPSENGLVRHHCGVCPPSHERGVCWELIEGNVGIQLQPDAEERLRAYQEREKLKNDASPQEVV